MKNDMPRFLYRLIQFTWGLPQTAAGLILFLFFYKYRHFTYRNAIITAWSDGADCVSLGPFIFISESFLTPQPGEPGQRSAEGKELLCTDDSRSGEGGEPGRKAPEGAGLLCSCGSRRSGGAEETGSIPMTPALERILRHEYGHSVQSMIFGPLYLLMVGLPSILWCRVPSIGRSWRSGRRSYYSFITERSADRLGGNERC